MNQWLETLSEDLLFKCSAAEPGPFAAVGWYKARSKLDKYGVVYKFQDLLEPDGGAGVRVRYSAHFGAIPGYREGDALAREPLPGPDPHAQGSGVVEIHLIVEECEERLSPDQTQELLQIVALLEGGGEAVGVDLDRAVAAQ